MTLDEEIYGPRHYTEYKSLVELDVKYRHNLSFKKEIELEDGSIKFEHSFPLISKPKVTIFYYDDETCMDREKYVIYLNRKLGKIKSIEFNSKEKKVYMFLENKLFGKSSMVWIDYNTGEINKVVI